MRNCEDQSGGSTEAAGFQSKLRVTNSMSIDSVYHATARYVCARDERIGRTDVTMPVVGECDDSYLNDATGFHVREEHVIQALESASEGPVAEGTVGSATGLHCFDFKGGIGTSSRQLPDQFGGYTIGVLVVLKRYFTNTVLSKTSFSIFSPADPYITNFPSEASQNAIIQYKIPNKH